MRQLLWKEWQERRLWLLLWAVAEVGTGVIAQTQSPFGMQQSVWELTASWLPLPTVLALLAGLGAYGSELTGARASFLYSRALSWKQVLLAKVLLGLTAVVGAPLLTAVIQCLCAPAQYRPFMTPAHLLLGMLWVILLTGIAFFIGLGCSIVLPGLAGSALALLGYVGISYLAVSMVQLLGYRPQVLTMIFLVIFGAAILAAPLLAAIVIARFGLTLSPGARVCRFTLLLIIPIIAGALLLLTSQQYQFGDQPPQLSSVCAKSVMSPSGWSTYAEWVVQNSTLQAYWVDLAGQRCLPLPSDQSFLAWTDNDCLLTKTDQQKTDLHGRAHRESADDCTITWLKNGQLRSHHFAIGQAYYTLPSPDGAKILFLTGKDIVVYDLHTEKMQRFSVGWPKNYCHCWWQTVDVIGYTDPYTGQRVLVKLGKE